MAFSKEATEQINDFMDHLVALGKHSHTGHDSDFRRFTKIVVDRYRSGEELHPDAVRDLALTWGWDETRAEQLGHDADVVVYTMKVVEPRHR